MHLLLLGNVDYDAEPGKAPADVLSSGNSSRSLPPEHLHFRPLPATEAEVVAIEKLYRHDVGDEGVTTLKKSQASKESFLTEARRHGYLHLATHGFFIAEKLPMSARADTRGGSPFGALLGRSEAAGMHPALLSGLALAGANHAGRSEGGKTSENDQGILTAEEIGTQNLDGVQLVVLSACESGLGQGAPGEGLLGLQRAFQSAGARNVVASLWPVDDEATCALMTVFYTKLWREHKRPIDALHAAQLYIYRHPDAIGKLVHPRGFDITDTDTLPAAPAAKPAKTASPQLWAAFVISGAGG
jgi:CHAT domain-containing protein